MDYQYADYTGRSKRLILAGEQLLESLQNEEVDRSIAIQDIESAAQPGPTSELVLRFASARNDQVPPSPAGTSPDDALSGLLLELQGANVLLSAGIALNEHGGGSDVSLLTQSVQNLEISQSAATQVLASRAALAFAPTAGVKSSDINAAKETFRENAQGVLKDIVDDAASVVNAVLEQLKKLDGAKILEGIDKLGESFESFAIAGRLIRQGLDKLKNALDALTKLFGKDLLASMKKQVAEIWQKFQSGEYIRDVLVRTFDVEGTEARIAAALAQVNIDISVVDGATNDLAPLSEKYKSNMKLFRSLNSAIALAAGIIAVLHVAAPWVPLAMLGVYAALIAATILVGMDYCDSGRVLNWVRGVGQIAKGIKPATS
jgi:hypothetical protein